MKFTCKQSDFNVALSAVSRAIPSRPSHPILANILIKIKEKQSIQVIAYDLSLGIFATFLAEVEDDDRSCITLPARLLTSIVSHLSDEDITLESLPGTNTVEITSSTGKYQIQGLDAEEYPVLPDVNNQNSLTLPVEFFNQGLNAALFAVSPDETKQVLTGLHLIVSLKKLEFAATDGHRLAMIEIPRDVDSIEMEDANFFEATIPGRALKELAKIIGSSKVESLSIAFESNQIAFGIGEQKMISRILKGKYPDYKQLIPTQFNKTVTINRKKIIDALERISILTATCVLLRISESDQCVYVTSEAKDIGIGEEIVFAQVTGGELSLSFASKYAIESLKHLETEEVQIHINSAKSPVIFTPLTGAKVVHLLMPIQLRSL
jgi:DNA polymerase-3 subunit beta